jgi:antitoxin component of MazEF toxin-antitoxin module
VPKYRAFKEGQSYVSIPKKVAQSLSWENGDEIHVETKVIDGKIGLFLVKTEKGIKLKEPKP